MTMIFGATSLGLNNRDLPTLIGTVLTRPILNELFTKIVQYNELLVLAYLDYHPARKSCAVISYEKKLLAAVNPASSLKIGAYIDKS